MSPRYFQGSSIHGPVKASSARTFREVVDTFRICPTLGITRQAFLALDKKERGEAKQVPFFVPACFKESPSKRTYDQATICNLIFLDVDPETRRTAGGKLEETGKYPAAPFVSNPDALHSALHGYNFAAHTTASSTPEKPRMRIVVDAHNIPINQYARAVQTVGMLLGLEVTTESKVAVQPMFLPTLFSDSGTEDDPLIAFSLDGRSFRVSDISESTTELVDSDAKKKAAPPPGSDALEFLSAPVPEITLHIAKEALDAIDPDCDFHQWTHMAMALRHQFSHNHDAEAYAIFDEWSSTGTKYGGSDETAKKWKYVHQTSSNRIPITIRTLLHDAVAAGWDDKRVKEKCFNSIKTWIEEVSTVTELVEKGAQRITATPLMGAVHEDILIHDLVTQAKKRFAYTISATAIRKDIARIKKEAKAQGTKADKVVEPKWAKGVCYVSSAGEFYRHQTGEKFKTESFNASYSRWLLPSEETLKDSSTPVNPATLSKPIVLPSDYALNHLKIPAVYEYTYDPSRPMDIFTVSRGRKFVNTYSPTYPELDPENAEKAGALFEKHMQVLIAEPEYQTVLTEFLAFLVQHPGHKIRWAPLIQGVQGCGKTFFAEAMKAVLGTEHVKIINTASVRSGYTDWAFGSQLVALEEIYAEGRSKNQIMNTMKELVTNDYIPINEKFRNHRVVENISNYMMFSNHHDALALSPGDRRYFVVKSALQQKSQITALGDDYFPPLYAMLRDNPGALRSWLKDWPISKSFRADGHAPRTKYTQELINDSADEATAAIRRLMVEGDYPLIQYDVVSSKTILDALHIAEGLTSITPQRIAQVLREEGLIQMGRHFFGTERHYLWARAGITENETVEKASDRHKNNLKNLHMDLLF